MSDSERIAMIAEWEPALRKAWDWAYERDDREGRAFFWLWILDLKGWQE
jgi:hypothetical protein